jgi:predicted nucleotidyltransferase
MSYWFIVRLTARMCTGPVEDRLPTACRCNWRNPMVAGSNPARALLGKARVRGPFCARGGAEERPGQRLGQQPCSGGVERRAYAVSMATFAQAALSAEQRRVIERWIEHLRDELDLESVWLFGSRARGQPEGEESDVDLLVITRGDPERDRQRAWALIDEAARELGADPAVYVPHTWDRAWLENRREIESFFVQDLDRDRIVLYGEP